MTDSGGVITPMVDPFLVEALQNPRHRLTILRMELDIQKFLRNSDQQEFEFQHFLTSYLRLAAHRVAQHYGLPTTVQDSFVDGQEKRILARKMAETVYPAVCLSDIPVKQSENDKLGLKKISIRARPGKASSNGNGEFGKRSSVRSVEERMEEYDRARARIFSGPSSPESDDTLSQTPVVDEKNINFIGEGVEGSRDPIMDLERSFNGKDGGTSSRVAIFRDLEKDRTDPDYDRSYDRYVRNRPSSQNFNLVPNNIQPHYLQYDSVFPHMRQMPSLQASLGYGVPVMSPYSTVGVNQTSMDAAVYMQWPSHSMMYAHSYDQFRHAVFQAPFCQQPLSFDYSQHH